MSLGADDEYYAELALARARKDAILTSADHGKDEVLAPRTLGDRNGYDSFDYDCYESQQWLNYQILKSDRQDGWIETLRWIMLAAVGFCTGCTAFFIDAVVKYIVKGKFWIISEIFDATDTTNGRGNFWTAFLVWLGMELFLCSIAGYLVCYIESCAAGSGIPEIKCRLNGIRMRRVLRLKTYFTKVLGVLFSVAGGLPVGKEGPMIHSGAIVGAGLNGLKSTTLGFDWLKHRPNSRMRAFRNDVDKRDMIAAGASAGVAAAFGAPIGGVLFALEEGCSFWNVKITWGNFFCAMVSSTTINVWMTGINMDVDFGLLSVPGMITFGNFAVSEATAYNIWECPYFIIIGCVGGLIGALFNHINMKLTVWRLHNVNFSSHRRMLEVMTVALVVSLFSILFPYIANDCTAIANPYNSYPLPPTQLGDRGACYAKDCKCEAELRGAIIQQSTTKWNYDCLYDPDLKDSLVQFACENYHYSPAASLSFNKGDEVIKGLLHNPEKVNMGTLFCFFSIYFILACWTYGIGVPSGLFVPSLIIGAAYGRFVGQALDDANMLSGQGDTVSDRLGVYALVGASAMLAGMARITISLTVILIECTNDVQYAVSIMLAVLFAKWVADCFNHGLYDIHIHLKHVPLLEPFSEKEMFLIQARHVMSSLNETGGPDYRVETLPKVCKLGDIITLLKETKHSSYPVVGYDDVFIGLMRRDILCAVISEGKEKLLQDTLEEIRVVQSWDVVQSLFPNYPTIEEATEWASDKQKELYIDLLPYCNTNAFTVHSNTNMRRVYTLFRGMGLRCLPVISWGSNKVIGTITREDLLGQPIEEGLEAAEKELAMIRRSGTFKEDLDDEDVVTQPPPSMGGQPAMELVTEQNPAAASRPQPRNKPLSNDHDESIVV